MKRESFITDLRASLCGPRRRRRRLIEEITAHIDDAVDAEMGRRMISRGEAEQMVMERLGAADTIACRWNADQHVLRTARRRRLAAAALASVAAAALAITQYAAGKPQPPGHERPTQTTPVPPPGRAVAS